MKVLEFVLFTGCLELLTFMRKIQKESQELDDTYKQVYPIYSYCYENFIDNALVITARERISTDMEKRNLLQGQKAEVEATPHKEPPPKPPDYFLNNAMVLSDTSTQMDEGKLKGKTIAELAAMYFSK